MRRTLVAIAALSISAALTSTASAEWPDQPVRIIAPFAPGGTSDVLGRLIANYLTRDFHQPFYIDNRAGASGMIGSAAVAKAEPDGYTLLISSLAGNIVAPNFYGNAAYDGVKGFTHIAFLGGPPVGLIVHPSLGIDNYAQFLAWAKARTGAIDFVSSGTGTNGYLFGMALAQKEHLDFNHIPYKGGGPAMLDLFAGRVKVATITFSSAAEQVRAGVVRALAVSTEKRVPDFPDVPTFRELGYDDMVSASWFALSGPPNLPGEIVDSLNREVAKILQEPEVRQHLARDAIENKPMTPAQVTAFFESENARWGPVAKATAIEKDK